MRWLTVGYYVVGGITALFASIPMLHIFMGIMMVSGTFGAKLGPEIAPAGWMFIVAGGAVVLIGWTLAILTLIAGRRISALRSHQFCFVIGCIQCAFLPLGTILGVFSILVLTRPSIKALFDAPAGSNAWTHK